MSTVPIVFGSMTFGEEGREQARVHDLETCQKILDIVKKRGSKEIDTARMYGAGTCEEYLGKLKVTEQGFQLATKIYPSARGLMKGGSKLWTHSKEDIHECLEDSLKALQVDSVDLYYLHAPDRETPFEETFEALNAEYEAGKFKRLGLSNYRHDEVEQICELCKTKGWVVPSVYQGVYNSITRQAEADLVPVLRKYNMAFYIFNPLAGGFATGAYENKDSDAKGKRFDADRVQGKMYRSRYFQDHYFEAVATLKPVAEKHNLTLTEIVLRWLNHHSVLSPEHGDRILIGASSTAHIEQNLVDLEKGPLDPEVVAALDKAWEIVKPHTFNYYH
ncbi:unnamed protein product [Tilletia controversa]|nr:unnamed protein product [Tilletia controversa]CAD6903455.1 unnamed protein product [Tilletia controversa]CAD6970168.1 unnamed protein product [Tilletia controversa]